MHKETPILVTGGTGLVGSYILRYLLALGYTNILASKLEHDVPTMVPDPQDVIDWIDCDLADTHAVYDLVADRTHIIHSAGMVSYKSRDHEALYEQNVEVTSTLVNAALDKDVVKFVHISSIEALMRKPGMVMIDEHVGWEESNLTSNYARSKFLGEMEVWRGHHEGLSTMILNPSLVIGAGFWNNSSLKLISGIDRGMRFYPAGTTGVVDVRDVARAALISLMDPTLHSIRVTISGSDVSYLELFTEIAQAIGAKRPKWVLTRLLGHLSLMSTAIRSGLGFNVPVSTSILHLWKENFHYSNELSKTALDLTYTPFSVTMSDVGQAYTKSKQAKRSYGQLDLVSLQELFARLQS